VTYAKPPAWEHMSDEAKESLLADLRVVFSTEKGYAVNMDKEKYNGYEIAGVGVISNNKK